MHSHRNSLGFDCSKENVIEFIHLLVATFGVDMWFFTLLVQKFGVLDCMELRQKIHSNCH